MAKARGEIARCFKMLMANSLPEFRHRLPVD
jgi:hypothetical protein